MPVVPGSGAVFEKAPSVRGPPAEAAVTAAAASNIPVPHSAVVHVLPVGNTADVDCRIETISDADVEGRTAFTSAATPATCGVAMLVP